MNSCSVCGANTQGLSGCQLCNQRNRYQQVYFGNWPQPQGTSPYQPMGGSNQYDIMKYDSILNQILASLLRLEQKLNEKKD